MRQTAWLSTPKATSLHCLYSALFRTGNIHHIERFNCSSRQIGRLRRYIDIRTRTTYSLSLLFIPAVQSPKSPITHYLRLLVHPYQHNHAFRITMGRFPFTRKSQSIFIWLHAQTPSQFEFPHQSLAANKTSRSSRHERIHSSLQRASATIYAITYHGTRPNLHFSTFRARCSSIIRPCRIFFETRCCRHPEQGRGRPLLLPHDLRHYSPHRRLGFHGRSRMAGGFSGTGYPRSYRFPA